MTENDFSPKQVAGLIDHTILKADATTEDVKRVCAEALEYGFASVCVNPSYVALAAKTLSGSGVPVCSVIAFPLGATTPVAKAEETNQAIAAGASEVDMVANIGAIKSGDWDAVEHDIRAVVDAADGRARVKVIIETCLLSDDEKVRVCQAAKRAGADYVKTSTGFSAAGATASDVALMRRVVGEDLGVKASGGIHTYSEACEMISAGATRLGTSSGVAIIEAARRSAERSSSPRD